MSDVRTSRSRRLARLLKPTVFVLALIPLASLVWAAFHDGLGVNPVQMISFRTGDWTLRFLLLTLAITPLRRLSGWQAPGRLRRMLGLFAFFYACLHVSTYLVLDASLDLFYIVDDVAKRRYITVGFMSFCLLVPLAATSTDAMLRKLGGRRWQRLHRLVYLAALGGVVHYLWLVKADSRRPLIYLSVLVVLLILRLPHISSQLPAVRASLRQTRAAVPTP